MNFDLNEEQKFWQETVHDFVAKEVGPKAREVDVTGEFNWTATRKMGPLGLLGLNRRILGHPFLAKGNKLGNRGFLITRNQVFNILLAFKPQLLLHLHLHPKTLGVKAVLKPLLKALHVFEALEKVFVGSPPSMVHAHRVIGGDGAIQKAEVLLGL